MTVAIMQPYLFPYIGYFQLIAAADTFVVYDDVAFIMRGWINRNRILLNGTDHLFTIPLQGASQNKLIREIALCDTPPWREKFLATLQMAYHAAPEFARCYPLIESIVRAAEHDLSAYITHSLTAIAGHLGIGTRIVPSSAVYGAGEFKGQERILAICAAEKADRYVNPIGGTALYDPAAFAARGIELRFLRTREIVYRQFTEPFVPSLSIIDVLMFNPPEAVRGMLAQYDLVRS